MPIDNPKKKESTAMRKRPDTITTILLAIYLLLLTAVIIFKLPFYSAELSDGVRVYNLVPYLGSFNDNGGLLLREITYNILLFVPLGIYICKMKPNLAFARKLLPIIGLSLLFETVQYIFAIGVADVTDLVDNTLGGIIGIGAYAVINKFLKERTGKALNIIAAIATTYVALRFAYLFRLSHFTMRR
ncbi:MAG: VanZ family protein [Oscillospiraceae bacterium]|nr:VanZ family protein [Oscillospiraceae bacterium]